MIVKSQRYYVYRWPSLVRIARGRFVFRMTMTDEQFAELNIRFHSKHPSCIERNAADSVRRTWRAIVIAINLIPALDRDGCHLCKAVFAQEAINSKGTLNPRFPFSVQVAHYPSSLHYTCYLF